MVEPNEFERSDSLDDATLIEPIDTCPPSQPAAVGRFKVVRLITQRSSTRIYEVTAPNASGQRLALKLLDTKRKSVSRWFERGVSVTASLNHPHILPCLESGRHHGCPFTVMPIVEGNSVQEIFYRQELLESVEVVRIARSVASALDYAHSRNIVHGDVHPKHILLEHTGHVFLIGFGEIGPGRPEAMFFGNPHHLAPEQFAEFGKNVPQTDQYALAEVVFHLLTRSFPFQGDYSLVDLYERKRSGPVPTIRKCRPDLPRSVDRVLQRAMAVRPEDRFRSAGQLVEKLDGASGLRHQGLKKWWQIWRLLAQRIDRRSPNLEHAGPG
jgi:serine/threonine-protein kinase